MAALFIDLGNTRLKWFLAENDDAEAGLPQDEVVNAISHHGDFSKTINACIDSLEGLIELSQVKAIYVSNVAGKEAEKIIQNVINEKFNIDAHFVNLEVDLDVNQTKQIARSKIKQKELLGIKIAYKDISQLGVDRFLAILGASELIVNQDDEATKGVKSEKVKKAKKSKKALNEALIVVNCGTAITIDYLDGNQVFQGGRIMPGFNLALCSLNQTADIFNETLFCQQHNKSTQNKSVNDAGDLGSVVGASTEQCVSLGVVAACVGGIEKSIAEIEALDMRLNMSKSQREIGDTNKLILIVSGGAASVFLDASNLECRYDANLVIRGLIRFASVHS
jgi:pantothenate kinase type III